MLYHLLDELATNPGSRLMAFSDKFSQRPRWTEYSANPAGEGRPLIPRAIPELSGIYDVIDQWGKLITSDGDSSARFASVSKFV